MHPNYEYGISEWSDWNLALLRLSEPVNVTDYVKPVCVPTADMEQEFRAGTLSTIIGWGATDEGKQLETIIETYLPSRMLI